MKLARFVLVVALLCALFPRLSHAAASCGGFVAPIVDGRVNVPFTVTNAADASVEFFLQPGHSYSAEVLLPDFDNTMSVIFGGADLGCPTADGAGWVHTEATSPNFVANGSTGSYRRASITIPGGNPANDFYALRVAVSITETVTVSISDTTMYNPRWSTFSGFITQWGFQNTTNTPINVTLAPVDVLGATHPAMTPKTFSVPANSAVFKIISATGGDFNPGAQHGGFATATHNGPPGAIKADAYFINGSATVIVPAEFKAVRESSH